MPECVDSKNCHREHRQRQQQPPQGGGERTGSLRQRRPVSWNRLSSVLSDIRKVRAVYRGDEPIAAAVQSLYEARVVRVVSQRLTQFLDAGVEPVVGIYGSIDRPEFLLQLLPRDRFSRAFQKNGQDLKGLLLQLDADPALAQFSLFEIELENPEVHNPRLNGRLHALHQSLV